VSARVLSLNMGSKAPNDAPGELPVTGITKRGVESAEVRDPGPKSGGLGSGLVGDYIANTRYHGGADQAVYAFAREELDLWAGRLGREIAPGTFGENLTTEGLAVDEARVGDRWAVGEEVLLEVTGPRTPCATFARAMGVSGWLKTFADHGRTGAYLSVLTGGTIRRGDAVRVVERQDHEVTVPLLFRAEMGDLAAMRTVVAAGVVPDHVQQWLLERLVKREA
jgi:MOSC domain-containing protein YiiM